MQQKAPCGFNLKKKRQLFTLPALKHYRNQLHSGRLPARFYKIEYQYNVADPKTEKFSGVFNKGSAHFSDIIKDNSLVVLPEPLYYAIDKHHAIRGIND